MKTIKKQLKRAFTIVELVIVIAVIAVLAAVLIPTFVNVLDSANVSNDTALAKNMNTTLTTYGTLKGKPETPHEALEALEEDGYLLKNMTPTADGYSYIWDQNTNSIALITEDFEIQYSQYDDILTNSDSILWAFVSTQSEVNAFSSSDYTFKYCITSDTALTVDNDFDSYIISNTNVTLSASGKSYTIYTDGGEVTIDAEYATVNHYGDASLVTVTAVDTNSYHVYGEVKMAVLTKGRLVVEDDASISILAINASSSSDVSLEVKTEKVSDAVSTIYATSDNSTISVKTSNDSTYADYSDVITTNAISSGGLSGITYVSTEDELESFISGGVGMCVLQDSIKIDSTISLSSSQFMMIDLNGKTLTSTSAYSNNVTDSSELTISNGTLSFDKIGANNRGALVAESNSKITLSNVDATTNGVMLYPSGDAAEVNVINSTLYTTGGFCISTNASTAYTCKIKVDGSTLQVEEGYCTICINVDVTLDIINSTIIGGNSEGKGSVMDDDRHGVAAQALLIRSGTVTMTNSTVTLYTDDTANETVFWYSDGNFAPYTAIVLGDATNAENYHKTNATLTMTGCTVNVLSAADGKTLEGGRAIYMYGKDEDGYRSSLTFDSSTTINGQIIVGGSTDVTVTNASYSAKYVCEVVTINGTSYAPTTNEDETTTGKKYTVSGTTLTEVTE